MCRNQKKNKIKDLNFLAKSSLDRRPTIPLSYSVAVKQSKKIDLRYHLSSRYIQKIMTTKKNHICDIHLA